MPAAAWTKAHDAASVVLVPTAFVGTVGAPPCHVEGAIEVHCTVEVDDAAEGVGARKGVVGADARRVTIDQLPVAGGQVGSEEARRMGDKQT